MGAASGTVRQRMPEREGIEMALREMRAIRQRLASDPAAMLGDCADDDLHGIMEAVDTCIDAYSARLEAAGQPSGT